MTEALGGTTEPKFRTWLRPDGILHQVWVPGAAIGLDDAVASIVAARALCGEQKRPLLVDVHAGGAMDRTARLEWARHNFLSAVALIVATPLSRMSGNFFLRVAQPDLPTRLFDDEDAAVAWLGSFVP